MVLNDWSVVRQKYPGQAQIKGVSSSRSIRGTVWCRMLASHQGSRTPAKRDGDEDVTMNGGCHTCGPHPQREDP
ncbi:hypothetical protein Y032_0040g200 [Ancylostoma ceylanicum]|uniref:Uncharacterized protein n=1 Tax=Ancylostoma ceylanicum TaxID=53326 RepID=A0A016UHX4_9BILA|nr:hypothetical protein Y032_0040g200 [Ancylostoma ceylanicum]